MRTPLSTRFIGFLLVVAPIVGLIFLAGPMLTPHPTWQRDVSVVVTDAEPNPEIANDFENLAVKDSRGNYFDLPWYGFVAQGERIKVWVMIPTSYEASFASQTPYPHQYHWVRVTAFVILSIIALCLVIYGLNLLFRE
jgi:hypothetical protein